jgi:hypothetical protein
MEVGGDCSSINMVPSHKNNKLLCLCDVAAAGVGEADPERVPLLGDGNPGYDNPAYTAQSYHLRKASS